MKLNRFQNENKKKRNFMIVSITLVLLVVGVIFYRTFALFEESEEYNFKESIPNYMNDSAIGLTLDGKAIANFPSQESGKGIDSILCDKGATGVWDYKNWTLKIQNVTESRTKCQVNFVSYYTESILNGTDPILKDGLIPVMIEEDGTVIKSSLAWDWYNYEEQRWANAVILENENITYHYGEIIPEENIESYFVWIPRYKYRIWNMGNYTGLDGVDYNQVHTIDVIFGTDTTSDTDTTCASPGISRESGTCSVGKYMTHPAFIAFDTPENTIKGIWVGKFETGYKWANTTKEAEVNAIDSSKIQIKPNVYSWRSIDVANAFYSAYEYKREYDSHMMKNTEWGSVAYLQYSTYGSQVSVRINNNSDFLTGYVDVVEPSCGNIGTNEDCNKYGTTSDITQRWNSAFGLLASTTGNISGIYDMSGGAWEYVMGIMVDNITGLPCRGTSSTNTSGFSGPYCYTGGSATGLSWQDLKYYDTYIYGKSDKDCSGRILGDATGEMGPFGEVEYASENKRQIGSWHEDETWFLFFYKPWFKRGGMYFMGAGAGIFSFNHEDGGSESKDNGFRIVLAF